MGLPACQQRVLDQMESALQASEPHLTSMYAVFTRLSGDEPIGAERLARKRPRCFQPGTSLYAIVLIPVMFAGIIIGSLLGGSARTAKACEVSYSVGGALPLAGRPSCRVPGMTVKVPSRKTVSATARLACPGEPARFTARVRAGQEFSPATRVEAATAGPPAMC